MRCPRATFIPTVTLMLLAALTLRAPVAHAQIQASALSDAEVEQIRDARLVPADCVLLFANSSTTARRRFTTSTPTPAALAARPTPAS